MTRDPGDTDVRTGAAPEDSVLVLRVRDGDAGALEELYGRYGRVSYAMARKVLIDEGLAQDVVQEVFLTVWRDAERFDARRGSFSTWLLSMTHHKAVDAVRREETLRRRRAAHEALEPRETELPDLDDEVWSVLRRERVRSALGALPGAQREALTLAYFGGYTQREIAGLTDTPLGTVKTRMLAGMRKMRDVLHGISDSTLDLDETSPGDAEPLR